MFLDFVTACEEVDEYLRWLSYMSCIEAQVVKLNAVMNFFEEAGQRECLLAHQIQHFEAAAAGDDHAYCEAHKLQRKFTRYYQIHVHNFIDEVEIFRPVSTGNYSNTPDLCRTNRDLKDLKEYSYEFENSYTSTTQRYRDAVLWFKNSTRSAVAKYRQGIECLTKDGSASFIAHFQQENGSEYYLSEALVSMQRASRQRNHMY